MNIRISSILILFVTIIFCGCSEQEKVTAPKFESHLVPAIQVSSEPRFYNLKDRMEHYQVTGLSIAIVKDGKIVWNEGYGYAQLQDSIKVNSKTVFQAGSLSKSITALLTMKLVEKGVLKLDQNIEDYLETWEFPKSKYATKTPITLKSLLSHTSGVKNNNHFGFPQDEPFPSLNSILNGYKNYKAVSMDTFPGIRYRYSNTGYAIIQKIIEDVTDKTLQEVAHEEIFVPFGMTNTNFSTRVYSETDTQTSYAFNRKGKRYKQYWFNAANKASGGLWTTAEDLSKFILGMQAALQSNQGFISQDMVGRMIKPVKAKYGLGFDIKKVQDSTIFYHTGKNRGYTNIMMGMDREKNGIVVLTNSDNGGYLFMEIVRGISDIYGWSFSKPEILETIDVPRNILETYVGTYQLVLEDETYTLKIVLDGNNLQLIDLDENNETYPLRALSDTKFRDIDDGEKVDFIKDEKGNIVLLWDEEYRFKRVNE